MDGTTSVVTLDHQQVAKNKRKKSSPKYMLTTSGSDDERTFSKDHHLDQTTDEDLVNLQDHHQNDQQTSEETTRENDISGQIPSTNFSINKIRKVENTTQPSSTTVQSLLTPFMSPSKISPLQSFNLQQQQHLFQQAAISAIAPQFTQQNNNPMNLSETEAKFREFAFKTMQELLNIYGLSFPPNEIIDVMKNQEMSESDFEVYSNVPLHKKKNFLAYKLEHLSFSRS